MCIRDRLEEVAAVKTEKAMSLHREVTTTTNKGCTSSRLIGVLKYKLINCVISAVQNLTTNLSFLTKTFAN